jgi:anti-sigma factor RsiW
MNEARYMELREAAWRRPLTAAEQTGLQDWLSAHPEARADWETETALSAALVRLPDAPVPSNFTARVLREIERNAAAQHAPAGVWRRWWPRAAAGACAVVVAVVGLQFHQAASRATLARSVVAVSSVAPTLSPDALADYESIRRLSPAPGADTELLALLQ